MSNHLLQERFINAPNLVELLRLRARESGDRNIYTFLADGESQETKVTYAELDEQAVMIASKLRRDENFKPGERVLLLYAPGLEFISAFFGCLYAGLVAVTVYPPDPNKLDASIDAIMGIADDCGPMAVLTSQSFFDLAGFVFPQYPDLEKMNWIISDRFEEGLPADWLSPEIDRETLALLQYTSGSTGTPKGVMLTHGNIIRNLLGICNMISEGPENHIGVSWMPFFHIAGLVISIIMPVCADVPCVLMSPLSFLEKPVRWLWAVSRYKATVSGGSNFGFDLCVKNVRPEQLEGVDLSSWDALINASEPVRAETIERFEEMLTPYGLKRNNFCASYGATEVTVLISGKRKDSNHNLIYYADSDALEDNRVVLSDSPRENFQPLVSNGEKLMDDYEIRVVDPEKLTLCPEDQAGEIWISGSSNAKGYWNKPQETEKEFNAFIADSEGGPFFRSGDLGFLKDGQVFVTGRLKDVIIIRGKNHHPQDIEATVLGSRPTLEPNGAVAFSVDADNAERLVVILEVPSGEEASPELLEDIKSAVAKKHGLQIYALLLVEVGAILKTRGSKVQRQACRKAFLKDEFSPTLKSVAETSGDEEKCSESSEILQVLDETEDSDERLAILNSYLQEKIAGILRVPIFKVSPGKRLAAFGLDSIASTGIKAEIDADFKSDLPLQSLFEETLEGLSGVLDSIRAGTFEADGSRVDLEAEAVLEPEIKIAEAYELPEKVEKIFITGATGFLGAYLLYELLKRTQADIYCLIRAADSDEGALRLRKQMESWFIWEEEFKNRIVPVVGDLSQKLLGISEERFDELSDEIDVIYHNGALVNFAYAYSMLKAPNVDSTREILKLSCAKKVKPLHYISTIGVFELSSLYSDAPGENVIRESDLLDCGHNLDMGYVQSKWVAEKLVLRAMERGLPIAVYRPARITGHSETGICNLDDLFCRMIKGCVQLGAAPTMNITDYLTPVDYVSRAIIHLSFQQESLGKIFHLANPQGIFFTDSIRWINNFGYSIKNLDYLEWRSLLLKADADNALTPLLSMFSAGLEKEFRNLEVDCRNALDGISGADIVCPPVESLLKVYLDYFANSGFIDEPSA